MIYPIFKQHADEEFMEEDAWDVQVIKTNNADHSWDGVVKKINKDGSEETLRTFRMYDMSSYFKESA